MAPSFYRNKFITAERKMKAKRFWGHSPTSSAYTSDSEKYESDTDSFDAMFQQAPIHDDISDSEAEQDFGDAALQDPDFADQDSEEETEPSEDSESENGDVEIIDVDSYVAPLGNIKVEEDAGSEDQVVEVIYIDDPDVIDLTEEMTVESEEIVEEDNDSVVESLPYVHRYLRSGKEY